MSASKMQYLNQKLSEYLNDKVSLYSQDGSIYSSTKRDEYLNRAMNYLFRFVINYSAQFTFYKTDVFIHLLPDLIKQVNNKTTSNTAPATFVLDNDTKDLYTILTIKLNSNNKILATVPPENYLIAESSYNTIYSYTEDKPAYSFIQNTIYFLPPNLTNRSFSITYIKAPVQDNGEMYSSNGIYDIPFKPNNFEIILQISKAFAMYDSNEIDYGQFLMQLSLLETTILKGGR